MVANHRSYYYSTKGYLLSIEKPLSDLDIEDILNRLDRLSWTGRVTNSTIGLIVPFKLAYEEMVYYYKELTESELKNLLLKNHVVILSKPEDLEKYRAGKDNVKRH